MGFSNVAISQFQKKIKTKREMMEFFQEECLEYIPPKKGFTAEWGRQVLRGEKK